MEPRRLLILDDDAAVGELLRAGAQSAGFETQLCLEARHFLAQLLPWQPSHIAVDLTLPDTTGEAVLEAVAAAGSRARVIVCSGSSGLQLASALSLAQRLGLAVAGSLPKPFRMAQLRGLLTDPSP